MTALAHAETARGPVRILSNGDGALVVEFGETIDLTLNEQVLALADRIGEASIEGVIETVPTFRSLLVSVDRSRIGLGALAARISALIPESARAPRPGRLWTLPVCYDPAVAPDLLEAAARVGLTPEAFAARHSGMIHHVYMLGFLPGQPYLGDLPAELALPRRQSPRAKVPAGSVGVALRMTCLFPRDTPCGLHVIGRTPAVLWDPRREGAALLAPGDSVRFAPVALDTFERLAEAAARGELIGAPAEEPRAERLS
jgi:inhibitor of KinA